MVHVQNLIGGRAAPALSGDTLVNTCPADGAVLGSAPRSGRADAEAAVAAAHAAFPAWASTPAPVRGDLVFKLARVLETRAEEISRALALEEGKIIAEARGEVQKALRYVIFSAGDARRMAGITVPSELAGTFAFTMWRPHGVVGLVTPWNFPVCIPLWKLAPALVAGNTVVLKPAPETPWTAALIGEICTEAGLPAGVVNVVHGDAEPAIALIEHPQVHAISFTGSTEVGLRIEAACGRLHKPVQCELGGKNPILVLDDADVDAAALACAQGAFGSTGQRCTATSRAIVDHAVADAFVERVVALAEAIVPGHPLQEGVSMGPSVSERQMDKVLSYNEVARDGGAVIRIGGARGTHGNLGQGYFPMPTVFDQVAPDARVATEEIFGPSLAVIRVGNTDEAIVAANAVEFGLTSSVYTSDLSRAFRVIERLDTGMTQINAPTMGGEGHLPFGGIKKTGVGPREMGPDAWKFYAESKTVYINHAAAARTSKFY
ncbi:MAG: aldehyde dehydrogenase family protein [Deltaproteobacteria bacterium]|nr:aldehyde dehydrogenase family protein [Deltaproteobacteria bacterium]